MMVCGCPFAPATLSLKEFIAPFRHGISIAEGRQEWLVERCEYFPGLAIRGRLTFSQSRHNSGACHVAFARKRCPIGIHIGLAHFGYGSLLQKEATVEFGRGLAVLYPRHKPIFKIQFRVRVARPREKKR